MLAVDYPNNDPRPAQPLINWLECGQPPRYLYKERRDHGADVANVAMLPMSGRQDGLPDPRQTLTLDTGY